MNKFLVFAFAVTVFAAGVLAVAPIERLSKAKVFLQTKATVAAKVEDAKAQLLVQKKKLQVSAKTLDPLYDDSSDPSGVRTEVAIVLTTRAANRQQDGLASKIEDPSAARALVNSVTHHCYWNDDNHDRVFLNLEEAPNSEFGSCATNRYSTCSFDKDQDFGTRNTGCVPDMHNCGNGDQPLFTDDSDSTPLNGKTVCNCAVSLPNKCRCLYELTHTQVAAFCTGDRAPKTF